jgi:hypothetical protein
VSVGIDLLLTMARRHEPGRAEQLVDEVVAAIATKPGWHEWLWKLRLSQARAELALARGDFEAATADATDCVDQSRAHGRLKYEALGLMTRARARRGQNLARQAIDAFVYQLGCEKTSRNFTGLVQKLPATMTR